ncbi:MAG: hypothetical protein GY928_34055 [Colwellia sp.]|nr:hypothetical protein [Colwellia sp.]
MSGTVYLLNHENGLDVDYSSLDNESGIALKTPGLDGTNTAAEFFATGVYPTRGIRRFNPYYFFKTNSVRVKMFIQNKLTIPNNKNVTILRVFDEMGNKTLRVRLRYRNSTGLTYRVRIKDDNGDNHNSNYTPVPHTPFSLDVSIENQSPPGNTSVIIRLNDAVSETMGPFTLGDGPKIKKTHVGLISSNDEPGVTGSIIIDEVGYYYNELSGPGAGALGGAGRTGNILDYFTITKNR